MAHKYPEGNVLYRKLQWEYPLIEHGEGVYLYDEKGKRYMDATGGPMLGNIGHGVPEIADAMAEQARKIEYIHGTQFTTRSIEECAKEMASIFPGDIDKMYLLSGGSEANESAAKLAIQYQGYSGNPRKSRIVGRWMSFHGCTLGTLSMGARPNERKFYEPIVISAFPHTVPCYCYRCPHGATYPQCDIRCAWDLEGLIKLERAETLAAFIAETISGTSLGAAVPPKEYFPIIRQICDKYEMLFIADEVMCGMGRTGRWWAIEHWNVVPDIITAGKGMSGGYIPIGVMATTPKVVNALSQKDASFSHGHTYTNTPMTSAVALAVLRYIKKHDLIQQSEKRGEYLGNKLQALSDFSFVGDIRGLGCFRAIEFVQDKKTKAPFPRSKKFVERVFQKLLDRGIVAYTGNGCADGVDGDLLMVSPPFIMTESQIDDLIGALKETFQAMEKEAKS